MQRSDAWALRLSGPSAVRVLHLGGDPASYGVRVEERTLVTQAPALSSGSDGAASDINNATRGVEVFGMYSVLVPEVQSAALLWDVDNAAPVYP